MTKDDRPDKRHKFIVRRKIGNGGDVNAGSDVKLPEITPESKAQTPDEGARHARSVLVGTAAILAGVLAMFLIIMIYLAQRTDSAVSDPNESFARLAERQDQRLGELADLLQQTREDVVQLQAQSAETHRRLGVLETYTADTNRRIDELIGVLRGTRLPPPPLAQPGVHSWPQ